MDHEMMTNANLNKPRSARSLTATLAIAFFTLSAVILVVNGSLALFTNIQNNQIAISNKQQLIAQDAAKTVSKFVQDKFGALETAVELTTPLNVNAETQKSILESLLGHDQAFRQFALLDSQGQQLALISRASQTLSSQFIVQLKGDVLSQTSKGQRYTSPVYIDDATSEPLLAIAIPIKDVFGDFQGTLIAEVNLKFMWQVVDQLKVGQTGYAYVVDNQGNLIAFGDTSRVLAGENVQQIFEVKEFIQNLSASTNITPEIANYSGLLGKNVVGTYVPLGSPEWAVITELPTNEAYQPIIGFMSGYIISMLALAVLAGVAGILIARRLSAPLVDLSNAATEFAGGNLEVEAKVAGPIEIAQVATTFNTMTSSLRELIGSLEQRVQDRTNELQKTSIQSEKRARDLQTIAEVSSSISAEQKIEKLLPLVTRLVSEKFGFYHVGIFLLDSSRRYAVLQAANSEGGWRMLARGHKLEVGLAGIVGRVSQTGTARIALDVGEDATFFNNPDLPETHSEMALPLKARGEIIGVLDVQSTETGAFSQTNANTLGILADQVAIAIENARLFSEVQRTLSETETLYGQYLGQEWNRQATKRPQVGYFQTLAGGKPVEKLVESDEIQQSSEKGKVVVHNSTVQAENQDENLSTVTIPLKLRGQTIGVLNVRAPSNDRIWNETEIGMLQSISERVSLALENARLLEDSQRRAARERSISEMSSKIGSAADIDAILRSTVEELGKTLGNAEVAIQISGQTENEK
jgi:GAF domain-containing protein/HAMP domain-containing protein